MLERLPVKTRAGSSAPKASTPEVEFALVLSRLIEAAESDPTQLRGSIYEIARVKLKEQLELESPAERQRLLEALETAIQGVEDFSQRNSGLPALLAQRFSGASSEDATSDRLRKFVAKRSQGNDGEGAETANRAASSRPLAAVLRFLGILALVGAAVYFASEYRHLANAVRSLNPPAQQSAGKEAVPFGEKWAPVASAAGSGEKQANPLLPDHFGVFAVSGNQLFEIEQVPGRAPDLRVAISATTTQPSKVSLPDGRLRFIVYRRDSAMNSVEKAEVRVVARIANKSSPKVDADFDGWVIRNIAYPLIAAPIKESTDMFELRSEQADFSLSPGRYVLVLRGATFDFSVQGDVSDPRQCLERFQAANGAFYSECKK